MCPIPNDFQDRAMDVISTHRESGNALRRATRHVLTRVTKYIDVDGGIFRNILHYADCTNFVT
jgi:hypothetical protein